MNGSAEKDDVAIETVDKDLASKSMMVAANVPRTDEQREHGVHAVDRRTTNSEWVGDGGAAVPSNEPEVSESRLAEIEAIFDHQQMPVLEKCELAKEYVTITADEISRQDVAKSAGRPEGAISLAARKLPVPGKSHGARKKWLERALAVANLSPAVKAEARKKGIARYQSRLLEVAAVEDEAAQLRKIEEITARLRKNAADKGWLRATIQYPAARKKAFLEELATLVEHFGAKLEV